MQRLEAIQPNEATGSVKNHLQAVQSKMGMVPNILKTMANSPAALEAYLGFSGALAGGVLSKKLREQIALTVAETNHCNFCLAAHTAAGKAVGLGEEEIIDSRRGTSPDSKVDAALQFAREVVEKRGWVSDDDFNRLHSSGYKDEEITEIIAHVALHNFLNYFSHIANPAIDFPAAPELVAL